MALDKLFKDAGYSKKWGEIKYNLYFKIYLEKHKDFADGYNKKWETRNENPVRVVGSRVSFSKKDK